MELLWLLGFGLLLSLLIMPWVAFSKARHAQAQLNALLREVQLQGVRLQQALKEIDKLREGAPAQRAADSEPQAESAPKPTPTPARPVPAKPELTDKPIARDLEPSVKIEPAAKPADSEPASVAKPPAASPMPGPQPAAPAKQAPVAARTEKAAAAEPRPAKSEPLSAPPSISEFDQRLAGWLQAAREWLFGGNLVAKVGLLILFIGVAMLVRLAAPYFSLPIEFRLAGVAAAAIGLLVWGWRIRERRRDIALPVQGAALAILMLVTFGAFKLFNLLPASAAFSLLLILVAFTCALAVLQDAVWLAVFGICGGFAAPILTSTGSGNYVALFSYYCVLNAGVLAIALKRSWRMLNVLGFLFTFVVGAAWGVQRYLPENYASTQPFLIIFWLFYIAIAILYATRRAPQLKSYVDGTLVFGVPTAGMALQYGLVKDIEYAMALSSLVIALTYASAASLLWRARGGTLRLLVESFLALAVMFGTLAIPLAFDGRWTSAVWAVEGAAIVWIGLKQRQPLAWRFGILVQLASWVSFVSAVSGLDPTAALRSNLWLGFLLLGGAGVLMALMFRGHDAASSGAEDRARARFGRLASGFIIVAAVWLLLGLWVEAWLRLSGGQRATVLVGTALVLAFGLQLLGKRAAWRLPDLLAGAVALVAGLVFAGLMLERMDWHNVASYPYLRFGDLLRDGPLLGGLLLSGGALVSALAFKRRALTTGSDSMRAPATWFLLAVFWFCGFALNGLAHAVAYLSGSAEGGTLWHTISFWAAYGIGLTSSTLAWVWLALRWKFLEPRTTLQSFWPILSWAGGAVFLLQATQQLQWARGASLEPSPLSFGDTLRALLGSPFLGALILCGISAYAMRRMTQAARESRDWRLAFGLSWYLLLLDPLAQFVVNSLVSVLPADLPWQPRYPDTMLLLVAASGAGFIGWAVRRRRLDLRWLAIPAFVLQAVVSAAVLVLLYSRGELPRLATGIALVGCWLAVAWGLREWQRQSWPLGPKTLQLMHFGRVIAPWLMLMPVVSLNLASWIWGDVPPRSGWLLRGQWPDYIASWLGILSLLLLLRQARQRGWPVQPLQTWYQHALIPLATLWGVLLAIYWNLRQDGSMAPLPYLPLLNPLDLTSGFVALLVAKVWQANRAQMSATLQLFAQRSTLALVFAWFNLMLLRTAAQYLSLRYRFDDLYASQFVQVMLSIVWTLSAFFLMRFAASRVSQPLYRVGMTLLFVVVVKLLVVDFGQVQGGARVISFIGVGGLFLVIAILAPFKRATEAKPITEQA